MNGNEKHDTLGRTTGIQSLAEQEITLDIAWINSLNLRDTLSSCHQILAHVEEFLEGPSPQGPEGASLKDGNTSGIVFKLCLITRTSHEELLHLQKRLVGIAQRLGAQV